MKRRHLLVVFSIMILLVACNPTSPVISTAFSTPSSGTASVSTVVGVLITPLPPYYTPPPTAVAPTLTPIPTLPSGLSPTELKYRLLDQFPNFFFCDPDYYPIAREDETALALQHFPEIQANSEEFTAILSHNNLPLLSSYTDEQKLLIYREHKKLAAIHFELADHAYKFQILVTETSKLSGELITGMIDGQGTIEIQQRSPAIATCPICLAEGTLIDTPNGPIPVQNLRVGMVVWTMDRAGVRIAKPVLRVGKTIVPTTHRVVHLVMKDGRELWVSPGHPTADGRRVGQLHAGDQLDGGTISSTELVRYTSYATYDLLPAGETGYYWANGILLASTIRN